MTRRDERLAGVIALVTGFLLTMSLLLQGTGPASTEADVILSWVVGNSVSVRLGSLVWLAAMLCLVAFAVLLRDALLMLTADRWWAGVLFVQGAAVFAAVTVIAAATAWATATLAAGADPQAETVASVWTLHRTVLRFATWGLAVPLATVGLTLTRHSTLGKIAAVFGVLVAGALLLPLTWMIGLPGVVGWLLLTSLALLRPRRPRLRRSRRAKAESQEPATTEGSENLDY